ncbi:hypothetical protein HMPREF1548_05557 [Clostridium sp. KLE 1755]|nr:hypothetical protein HMPREF1548_05557 [Clostridium sp. KLE 1755]
MLRVRTVQCMRSTLTEAYFYSNEYHGAESRQVSVPIRSFSGGHRFLHFRV